MNTWNRWENQPDELDEDMDVASTMTGASYPDPWEGDHDIEYWVWHGSRLLPATPHEVASIKEDERTSAALYRLERMQQRERPVRRHVFWRFSRIRAWGVRRLSTIARTPENRGSGERASHTEGAQAE